MKRLIALIVFFCAAATGGYAQFSIGAQGGLVVANFHDQFGPKGGYGTDVFPKARVTYKAGVTLQYMFSPAWGIQSGVNLKETGNSNSYGIIHYSENLDANKVACWASLRYVEIPVMAVYKYAINENIRIGIRAGSYLAYGYGGRGTLRDDVYGSIKIPDVFKEFNLRADYTLDAANRWDFGLTGGLLLDVYNFSNVYDHYPVMPSYVVKNRVYWIGLGYQFKL